MTKSGQNSRARTSLGRKNEGQTVYEQKISQEINSKTKKTETGKCTLHVSVNTHPDHIIVPLVFEREEVLWKLGLTSLRG